MTTTRSPWFWIAIGLAIIFAFLFFRSCKQTSAPTPNYKPELDSVQLVKSADSIRMKKRTDSLESLLQFADMREDIYRAQLGADGDKIKFLSSLIRNTKHDTIRTPYEIACDSLAIISPMYVSLVDSFARVVKGKDSIQDAIQLAWQERDSLTNLAYLSTVDIAVR